MDRELRSWFRLSGMLGAALLIAALLGGRSVPPHDRAGIQNAGLVGLGLLVLVVVGAFWRRTLETVLDQVDRSVARRPASRARLTIFIASFAALFLELALIRYTGSQLRVFSFFKNVPLIAVYLGLGIGCALSAGRPRHVLSFLLWFVSLAAFLSGGAFVFSGSLGRAAAVASTEQVLGDIAIASVSGMGAVIGQIAMGVFCLASLLALASLFIPLGRLLGGAFEQLPRLPAYTLNILGSLAGILAFVLCSYLWIPPWLWMVVGLAPLLWWLDGRRDVLLATGLIVLSALAVVPSVGETIWSPYQKLVGQSVAIRPSPSVVMTGYLVDISDVFYQVAVDLRPDSIAAAGANPYPHYDATFRDVPRPIRRVLIVGAGTGNDVAAALRAGAEAVDAVDIDPAIVSLGRHHPEQPYSDPRVRVIVDDARAAFRRLPAGSYDAVLFGLLDSHTQLGMSSVRLDNYVFTRQSFEEAGRLLRPGGRIIVTAATFREWFRERFIALLAATCQSEVSVRDVPGSPWTTYECQVRGSGPNAAVVHPNALVPTDDWPFLYLPERAVPGAYVLVVVVLALASVLLIRSYGLSPKRFSIDEAHLFFLGAAFLLMEVYGINRLALLFGTTWTVSAIAVAVVLTLIVAANLASMAFPTLPYGVGYAGLLVSLLLSYALSPDAALGLGFGTSIAYSFAALLPVFFAGLVFARSFARAPIAGTALGANMLGAAVGGWVEYSSMALGIRALLLMALAFYVASFICLAAGRMNLRSGAPAEFGDAA